MEAPTWATNVVAWLAAFVLVFLVNHLRRRKLNLPPGPNPWPIFGNLNLIGSLPHHSIHELSKKYGPIMMLRFGSVPVLVGSSTKIAKLLLKTNDLILADRPKTAAGKYTGYNNFDITWSPYGPYWRQARKMCLMELFSAKRLKSFEYIRVEELNLMLKGIFNTDGKPMILKQHISTLSLNVISRMVLGKRYMEKINKGKSIVTVEEYKWMTEEWFYLNGVLNLGDWIPSVKYLDIQGYEKRMKNLGNKFGAFMEHVVDEHNDRREKEKHNWEPNDMVDVLLQVADDPTLEVALERVGVKAFTQDLLVGGTETSTILVEWIFSELIRRPDIVAKATKELNNVIGMERWIEEKDIQNLPYIRAIIKETMRLHPVGPLLAPHLAREHVKIEGYDIPKGTVVFVNTFTIQRDSKLYERPEEFWPERYIKMSHIDFIGQNYEFLPFGSGRRMCPGYSLGLKIIELSVANLLQGFVWKLPDNMKVEDLVMDEIWGLSVPMKIPLKAYVEPRLPHHLYNM